MKDKIDAVEEKKKRTITEYLIGGRWVRVAWFRNLVEDTREVEVSDTTGDSSSNVAGNKQYSLSEVKELLKKQRENCFNAFKEALNEIGVEIIKPEIITNAPEPDLTPNKDKEGIDVASDSKPDEALLATLGSDSGNYVEQCGVCGGGKVAIRGKYPKQEQRLICPTCTYERLEQIHEISSSNYGKTYKTEK